MSLTKWFSEAFSRSSRRRAPLPGGPDQLDPSVVDKLPANDAVPTVTATPADSYARAFRSACDFSNARYPDPLRRPLSPVDESLHGILSQHARICLPDALFREMARQTDPVWAFGTQCANVHAYAVERLRHNHAHISFELTIGGIWADEDGIFPYTAAEFEEHVVAKPDRFMGHAWITCGDRLIIDLTLGTYLVNVHQRRKRYGQVIYGEPGALALAPFRDGIAPSTSLTYLPVAIGTAALMAVSPTYQQWAGQP